jgi:putative peptide zinc metalloprotease protein
MSSASSSGGEAMAKKEKIFHESWYLIANQRLALRASVCIKRQIFRGTQWYVLHDPFSNQYYRLRPNAYEFIARLSKKKTVEEVWYELLEHSPEKAPSQGEIIDLLAQLYHSNLLHYDRAPDSIKLFERYKKRRRSLVKMNIMNIMFARIPLYDPDNLLKFLQPLIRLIIGPAGLALWIVMVVIGIKTAVENWNALQVQTDGLLAPSNLFLLYAGVVFTKIIHELGHAFAVRRFGGEVHAMGVMLMMMTPLPYTDATASWTFRSKWLRIFVGGSGMIFELFVASIAILVWAGTGEGTIHSLAYNMVFTASVTTVLFNINPLLRYDGYYMLSDLIGMPNLQQQATKQLTYVIERWAFGKKDGTPVASSVKETWLLSVFAVASFVYRIVVFSGILLFVSGKLLLVAIIMGIFFTISWAIMPIVKAIKYLTTSPDLTRIRGRAIRVSAGTAIVVFAFLNYIPFPYSFMAPGVLKAVGYVLAVNPTAGRVTSLGLPSGARAKSGDTLAILDNTELRDQRIETEAALREARGEFAKALDRSQADLEPMEKRIAAYSQRLENLDRQLAALTVTAGIDGIWAAPDIDDFPGRWLPRGTALGQLINPERFYFVSVIPQKDISELFSQKVGAARVRLKGQADELISVTEFNTIPMEQNQLPSAALGFLGGGDIAVSQGDSAGIRTTEPFYEVRAVVGKTRDALLLHGRSGKIRFDLGRRPLLWQGWRKVRQLVQKHYKI